VTVDSDGGPVTANRVSPERLLAQVGGVSGLLYSSLPLEAATKVTTGSDE